MGMRKKMRTKWKADRKVAIQKISAKRRKKALKEAGKEEENPSTVAQGKKAPAKKATSSAKAPAVKQAKKAA